MMTIPCPKPFKSFLLIQTPSSFIDPSISPNNISNHPYPTVRKDTPTTPSAAPAIPHFRLCQNSVSILRPATDPLGNILAAPGQSGWYEPLLLHFPPSMPVRDICPPPGREATRARGGPSTLSSPPQFSARLRA